MQYMYVAGPGGGGVTPLCGLHRGTVFNHPTLTGVYDYVGSAYDSDSDSDSAASENQLFERHQ